MGIVILPLLDSDAATKPSADVAERDTAAITAKPHPPAVRITVGLAPHSFPGWVSPITAHRIATVRKSLITVAYIIFRSSLLGCV